MKTALFLSRHGSKDNDHGSTWTGHFDIELSQKGRDEARQLGKAMRDVELAAVITSTMKRGVASGEEFLKGYRRPIAHERFDSLREMSHGDVDGLTTEEFKERHSEIIDAWSRDEDPRFPNGENFADVQERLVPTITHLLKTYEGKKILLIGHKSTNMVLLGYFLHVPLPFRYIPQQKNCYLTLLTFSGNKCKLEYANCPPEIARY